MRILYVFILTSMPVMAEDRLPNFAETSFELGTILEKIGTKQEYSKDDPARAIYLLAIRSKISVEFQYYKEMADKILSNDQEGKENATEKFISLLQEYSHGAPAGFKEIVYYLKNPNSLEVAKKTAASDLLDGIRMAPHFPDRRLIHVLNDALSPRVKEPK